MTRNMAKCDKCGDVIESKGHHHFVSCSCGAIFVDGGTSYCRAGFRDPGDLIPLYTSEQRKEAGVHD